MDDTSNMLRIAHRSTRGGGRFVKPRWTELSVYVTAGEGDRRDFIAEVKGCTSVAGEETRVDQLRTDSLARSLRHFEDGAGNLSLPARSVVDQAQLWAEQDWRSTAPIVWPTYTEEQREAASSVLRRRAATGEIADPNAYTGTSTDGERYGRTVDAVASALGMKRETARG